MSPGQILQIRKLPISWASRLSSHGLESVLIGRDLLVKNLGWIVGIGTSINMWNDPWLSSTDQLIPYGPAPEALNDLLVSDLIVEISTVWDIQKIETILPFHKTEILQIIPSVCNAPDNKSASRHPLGITQQNPVTEHKLSLCFWKTLLHLKQTMIG